ncbi:MAG: NYN domain-containing protein [Thermoleophilia bacterium]
MLYIIDGYNLMHALAPGEITAANLEEQRRVLVEQVINFVGGSGDCAAVVFDSARARGATAHEIPHTAVTVHYASAAESADILIGKLVRRELDARSAHPGKNPTRIRVVSADWEVQRGVMQEHVERLSPRNFITNLKKSEKGVANQPGMDRMRWKLEHKVDVETLRKLEDLRRGRG